MSTAESLRKAVEARLKEIEAEAEKLRSILSNGHVVERTMTVKTKGNHRRKKRGHLVPIAARDEIHAWLLHLLESGPKSRQEIYARAVDPKASYPSARKAAVKRGRNDAIRKQVGNEIWKSVKHRKTVMIDNGKFKLAPKQPAAKAVGHLGKITMA